MTIKSLKRGFIIIFFALFLGTLFIKGVMTIDPDFGYRLRNGELILRNGVPKSDPYSYTMPSYPYVEHAWLTAVGFFYVYKLFGYWALSMLLALVVFLSLIVSVKRTELKTSTLKTISKNQLYNRKYWYLYSFQFLLATAAILQFVGVRAQVISWLLVSVLIFVSQKEGLWKKWRILAPLFFVVWSNLHGSFAAGIVILAIVVFGRSLRVRRLEASDILILLASVFATIVNPYGLGAWREVWSSVSDPLLRAQIAEWRSPIFMGDFPFWIYASFAVMVVLKYRKKFKLEELGLFVGVFIQTMLSRRHVPLLLIVSLPMTIEGVGFFYRDILNIRYAKRRLHKLLKAAWLSAVVVLAVQSVSSIKNAYIMREDFYPKEAVAYLKNSLPEGEILSEYGWGGYLIWKMPEKKVFIDGRMPSWRRDNAPEEESNYIFQDYIDLFKGDLEYKQVFEKYGIEIVLWPTPSKPNRVKKLVLKIENYIKRAKGRNTDFDLFKELEKDGWQSTYKDSVATIYKKPS